MTVVKDAKLPGLYCCTLLETGLGDVNPNISQRFIGSSLDDWTITLTQRGESGELQGWRKSCWEDVAPWTGSRPWGLRKMGRFRGVCLNSALQVVEQTMRFQQSADVRPETAVDFTNRMDDEHQAGTFEKQRGLPLRLGEPFGVNCSCMLHFPSSMTWWHGVSEPMDAQNIPNNYNILSAWEPSFMGWYHS